MQRLHNTITHCMLASYSRSFFVNLDSFVGRSYGSSLTIANHHCRAYHVPTITNMCPTLPLSTFIVDSRGKWMLRSDYKESCTVYVAPQKHVGSGGMVECTINGNDA